MSIRDWSHKDEWKRSGRNYLVSVSRHSVERIEEAACFDSEGPHRWAVYAYVYPNHPLFPRFNPEAGIHGQPSLPGHWYASFFRAHHDKDGITAYQLGWDYNHDGDWMFTQMETSSDAFEVFADAERLFTELEEIAKEPAA